MNTTDHSIDYFGETYSTYSPECLKYLHPTGYFGIQSHSALAGRDYRCEMIGVYSDHFAAANDAVRIDRAQVPSATWMTLNPVVPEAVGLSNATMTRVSNGKGLNDNWIASRCNFLVDVDAVTTLSNGKVVKGINSTNEELKQAIDARHKCADLIYSECSVRGIETISGNGAGLLFAIEPMPCDEESDRIIEGATVWLHSRIGAVDTSTTDRSRKTKLPGTMARKADESEGRPHRMSALRLPESRLLIPRAVLKGWADSHTKSSVSVPATIPKSDKPTVVKSDKPTVDKKPMSNFTLDDLREAFKFLDPSESHDKWFKKLAGAHHQCGDEAKEIARDWSKGSDKYPGDAKFDSEWASIRGECDNPVTIASLIRDAETNGYVRPGRPKVSNYTIVTTGKSTKQVPLPLQEVAQQAERVGIEFYNRDGQLIAYYDNIAHELKSPAQLVAVLSLVADVEWIQSGPAKNELLEFLKFNATKIRAVESVPHFPPLPEVLYTHRAVHASSSTSEVKKTVDACNPNSDQDAQLIEACINATHWGGPPAARPMMLITSEGGVGGGKTSAAVLMGSTGPYAEGTHTVRRLRDEEDVGLLAKHLVTPSKHLIRNVLLDNAKGEVGGEAIESFATSPTINGHNMGRGLGVVPNYYSVIVTTNSKDVTPDIASRAVHINIKAAVYGTEHAKLVASIDRPRLWSEIAGFFQRQPVQLMEYTRFPIWCSEILGRMPNPNALVQLIKQRSNALADNTNMALEIRERVEQLVRTRGHDPLTEVVQLPPSDLAMVLAGIDGRKNYTSRSATTLLKDHIGNPALLELDVNRDTSSRGFIWRGVASDSATAKVALGSFKF